MTVDFEMGLKSEQRIERTKSFIAVIIGEENPI